MTNDTSTRIARRCRMRAAWWAALLLLAPMASSAGDYDIYAQIGDIRGDSQDPRHRDWIRIFGFGHGGSREAGIHVGGGSSDRARFEDARLLKLVDVASVPLFAEANEHERAIGRAVIDFVSRTPSRASIFKITLEDVYVTQISTTGPTGGLVGREVVGLTFSSITWRVNLVDPDTGEPTGEYVEHGWDVAGNKGI